MRVALLLLIGLLAATKCDAAPIDQGWVAEATAGWARWEEQTRYLETEFRQLRLVPSDSEPNRMETDVDTTWHYFHNGKLFRRSMIKSNQDSEDRIEAISVFRFGKYAFEAERRNDAPYFVTDISTSANESAIPAHEFHYALEAPYSIEHTNLRKLVANPSFTIDRVRQIGEKDANDRLVEVEFRYDTSRDPQARFDSGKVVLKPADNWAVQSSRIRTPDGYVQENHILYGGRENGFQPIRKVTCDYLGKGGTPSSHASETYEFIRYEESHRPEDFFSLAANGLPESLAETSGLRRWWLIIANIGLLCLIAAGLIWRKRKRAT